MWKRHRRFAAEGHWDRVHAVLLTHADAPGNRRNRVVDTRINRVHQHGTNLPAVQGDPLNYQNRWTEPYDHSFGPSRGGLCAKIHQACDGNGRPLAFIIGPGQGSDSRMLAHVIGHQRLARPDA
ncbi:transposase [Arthrobacter sp. V1I7]|nr:transposase [Arthrobacter sp. V1I7]